MFGAHVLQGSNIGQAKWKKSSAAGTRNWSDIYINGSLTIHTSRPARAPPQSGWKLPGKSATSMPTLGAPVGGGLIADVATATKNLSLLTIVSCFALAKSRGMLLFRCFCRANTSVAELEPVTVEFERYQSTGKQRPCPCMSPKQANFSPWAGRGTKGRIQCVS